MSGDITEGSLQWPRWKPWDFFGYYNLGPVQIPPALPIVGMTDRATGKVWYLCFDPSNGNRISLSDVKPTAAPLRVFAAFDGPVLGTTGARLGVDSTSGTTRVVLDLGAEPGDSGPAPVGFQLTSGSANYSILEPVYTGSSITRLGYEILVRSPPNPTGPATPPVSGT